MPKDEEATPLEDTRDLKTLCKNAIILKGTAPGLYDNVDECKSFFGKNPEYLPTDIYNKFVEKGELKQFKYKERSGNFIANLLPRQLAKPLGGIGIKSRKLSDTAADCRVENGTRLVNVVDETSRRRGKYYVRPLCIPIDNDQGFNQDYENFNMEDYKKTSYYDEDF